MAFEWTDHRIEILTTKYVVFNEPSDKLAGDRQLASSFARLVNKKLGNTTTTADEMVRKLISLRKSGKLPTIRFSTAIKDASKAR
jgi:hypothetical protein